MKMKKIIPSIIAACLIVGILLGGAALLWRREINDTTVLRSYRIESESKALAPVKEFRDLCKRRNGIHLLDSTSKSHLYIRFAADRERAEALGYSLDGLDEYGYLIGRRGNSIYVLSPSENGLNRGCFYLASRLVDDRGRILLAQDRQYKDDGKDMAEDVLLWEEALSSYRLISTDSGTERAVSEFEYYFIQSSKNRIQRGTEEGDSCIVFKIDGKMDGGTGNTEYRDGNIYFTAQNEEALMDEVHSFANQYLNWTHAGTAEEKRGSNTKWIQVRSNIFSDEAPWMEKREAIITLWNTNYSRGTFLNDSTSLKTNILSMSDEQLYEYVRMLKYCGFNGIQLTDMCSAWAGAGDYKFAHERMRVLADAAHEQGMSVTLWVWGAEFTGYGWVDNSVTYLPGEYEFAYENPEVVATFEKYYSIYTELADCSDRVIAHFHDPGNLETAEDVGYFSNLLRNKFLAINPDIDFGVSCWVDVFDKEKLVEALGNQITLYEGTQQDNPEVYENFRSFCAVRGCRLGHWAWNTCEMEIDQLAQMNFNPHYEKNVYQAAKKYDGIMKPEYWSEMDSNHVINVFSLYCAGQLLIDPDRSPEQLTEEVALAAVGEEYAEDFAEVLRLLEDARTGDSRNTFSWDGSDYVLKRKDYPAEDILVRSRNAIDSLQNMIDENASANTLPLPLELTDVLKLMLPQMEQIHSYAQFRIDLKRAEEMQGAVTGEEMNEYLLKLCRPVSEYNTVTGLWGQVEARAQMELLMEFCEGNGYGMPYDPAFRWTQKRRIYDYFTSYQKGHDKPVLQYEPYFQYGIAYGRDITIELVNELIDEGLFQVDDATGGVYVADWEHYKYAFN